VAHRGRSTADEALAAALAAGKAVKDAATAAGVAERTAFRRLTDPKFKSRVSAIRGEMVANAAGRLADGMSEAAEVLRALLSDPDPHVRHKAAAKLIELSVRVRDQVELEDRLARLEALAAEQPKEGR
jgi:HEAT repeat protein